MIDGVADEVESGHTEAFFVDGVVEEGKIIRDKGDANYGEMSGEAGVIAKIEGEVAGNDNGFFAVGKIVVKVASEIMVFSMISGCCAHDAPFWLCIIYIILPMRRKGIIRYKE